MKPDHSIPAEGRVSTDVSTTTATHRLTDLPDEAAVNRTAPKENEGWWALLSERATTSAWFGYGLAVLGTAAAAFVRWGLGKLVGEALPPYITFYPVIILSALLSGRLAGLLATVLSAATVAAVFTWPLDLADITGLALFTGINVAMSYIGGALWTARGRAQAAARELARMNDELEVKVQARTAELHKTIGELEHFSYSLTHDMRAPLRAMRSFATLLLTECVWSLTREGKNYLENVAKSADRMDQLVVDALDYSKAMREKLPLAAVDADALLRGMLESYPAFQPSLASIQIQGTIPPVVGNRAGLTQCFSNLLNNAVKFVPPGQKAQVRIWAEQGGGRVRVWFEDKGIGIPKDDHARIFEMFQRLNLDYPGTGIGLALVHKVIERMNGRVGVESEPGQGSRFWLDLEAVNAVKQETV